MRQMLCEASFAPSASGCAQRREGILSKFCHVLRSLSCFFSRDSFCKNVLQCESCCSCFSQKSSLLRHKRIKHDVEKDCGDSDVAQHALAALKLLQGSHTPTNNAIAAQMEPSGSLGLLGTLEDKASCDVVELRDKLNPAGEVHMLVTQRIVRQSPSRCYYVCEYCAKEFSKSYDLIR